MPKAVTTSEFLNIKEQGCFSDLSRWFLLEVIKVYAVANGGVKESWQFSSQQSRDNRDCLALTNTTLYRSQLFSYKKSRFAEVSNDHFISMTASVKSVIAWEIGE